MNVKQMKRTLPLIHHAIMDVMVEGRIDQQSRRRLSEAAPLALELSQALDAAPPPDRKLLDRIWGFLVRVVELLGTTHVD